MTRRLWWLAGLAAAVVVVVVLAPLASSAPDGLQRVAADVGFSEQASDPAFTVLPGYSVPGLLDGDASLVLAGLIGVILLFASMWLLGRLLTRRNRSAG